MDKHFLMDHFLPNLFIPGAAKSGTSSLHELLDKHPDICMSSIKEAVYWDHDYLIQFNDKKKESYANLFLNKNAQVFGESTTSYMYYPKFIENLNLNYKVPPKFIFILRNPIDRCYSHYWWMHGLGLEKRLFEQAVEFDISRDLKPYTYYPDYYFNFGLYGKWLTFFYENFPKENIKIITLENLKQNRLETINECYLFLGLKELEELPEVVLNKTQKIKYPKLYHFNLKYLQNKLKLNKVLKQIVSENLANGIKTRLKNVDFLNYKQPLEYPNITSDQRKWLYSIYYEDVKILKKITNHDFNEWLDFKN